MGFRTATALVFAALVGAACTNDYDAILADASGGGTAATAGGSTSASTSTSTSTSTTSGDSTSSVGGGNGGAGGAGTGGSSGTGGDDAELPGATPCDLQLQLDVEIDSLPNDWSYEESGDVNDVEAVAGDGRFVFRFTDDDAQGELVHDLEEADLDGCSIATSVLELPDLSDFEDGTFASAYLALKDGGNDVVRIQLFRRAGDGDVGNVTFRTAVADLEDGGETDILAPEVHDEGLPTGLRLRGYEGDLFFDLQIEGQPWKELGSVPLASLSGTIDKVVFGGDREAPSNENDPFVIALGPLNDP